MNSSIQSAGSAIIAPKLLGRFRLRWLLYGAAAYYGLKLMSRNGIFSKQADAALDVIDRGIDVAKSRVGFSSSNADIVTH